MFTCRDATHMMTDEREGALEGWGGARYRLHLFLCFHCRRCRRQLDEAIVLSKDVPAEVVSPDVEENALAAFRARPKP